MSFQKKKGKTTKTCIAYSKKITRRFRFLLLYPLSVEHYYLPLSVETWTNMIMGLLGSINNDHNSYNTWKCHNNGSALKEIFNQQIWYVNLLQL